MVRGDLSVGVGGLRSGRFVELREEVVQLGHKRLVLLVLEVSTQCDMRVALDVDDVPVQHAVLSSDVFERAFHDRSSKVFLEERDRVCGSCNEPWIHVPSVCVDSIEPLEAVVDCRLEVAREDFGHLVHEDDCPSERGLVHLLLHGSFDLHARVPLQEVDIPFDILAGLRAVETADCLVSVEAKLHAVTQAFEARLVLACRAGCRDC